MRRHRSPFSIVASLCVGVALALAATGCGDDGDGGGGSGGGDADARALLKAAASKPIDSADFNVRVVSNVPNFPILASRIVVTGQGLFEWKQSGSLPNLVSTFLLDAAGSQFASQAKSVEDRVYVEFQGTSYEVDPNLIGRLERHEIKRATDQGGVSLKQLGIDPSGWVTGASVEEGEEIGGVPTRLVSGELDVEAAVADASQAATDTKVAKELGRATGEQKPREISAKAIDSVKEAIESVDLEVNVDDEGYARRLYAKVDFELPDDVEDAAFEGGALSFELIFNQIGGVDVDQPVVKIGGKEIATPPLPSSRPLSDLLDLLDVFFGVDELSDLWTAPR